MHNTAYLRTYFTTHESSAHARVSHTTRDNDLTVPAEFGGSAPIQGSPTDYGSLKSRTVVADSYLEFMYCEPVEY